MQIQLIYNESLQLVGPTYRLTAGITYCKLGVFYRYNIFSDIWEEFIARQFNEM